MSYLHMACCKVIRISVCPAAYEGPLLQGSKGIFARPFRSFLYVLELQQLKHRRKCQEELPAAEHGELGCTDAVRYCSNCLGTPKARIMLYSDPYSLL